MHNNPNPDEPIGPWLLEGCNFEPQPSNSTRTATSVTITIPTPVLSTVKRKHKRKDLQN